MAEVQPCQPQRFETKDRPPATKSATTESGALRSLVENPTCVSILRVFEPLIDDLRDPPRRSPVAVGKRAAAHRGARRRVVEQPEDSCDDGSGRSADQQRA